ncbi:MAG: FKBP-type peptidyl-prolyl cis-trans isomerase [Chitinophagaceae bacterium]
MLQRISLITLFCFTLVNAFAQTKPSQNAVIKTSPVQQIQQPVLPTYNLKKKTKNGIAYDFIINKATSPNPKKGDFIKLHLISSINGNVMYSSRTANKGKAAEFSMSDPAFKGDIIEVIAFMSPGDSVIAQANAIDVFNGTKNKIPNGVTKSDKITYFIKLVSVKTVAEQQKEQQAKIQKQLQEQAAKQIKEAKAQHAKDDKALQSYFKQKNITPLKTNSGLYYSIEKEGSGEKPSANDKVSMNYRGTLLDGTIFDSNIDSVFKHVNAFEFKLGKGQVIKGWDEGIALLNKGTKATLYIPSTLAYGATPRPGGEANPKGIPANSPLVFDVEVVDIKKPINEDEVLKAYFKEHNLNPTRTASGLYYIIKENGEGELAKENQEINMNYNGYLLDGSKFDSNTDSLFAHVSPFKFTLGKGQVIKGWDEGIALLNKGAKASLYIPSNLAYGQRSMPGNQANPKGIPAESILIFDVEVMDIK